MMPVVRMFTGQVNGLMRRCARSFCVRCHVNEPHRRRGCQRCRRRAIILTLPAAWQVDIVTWGMALTALISPDPRYPKPHSTPESASLRPCP